MNLKTEGNYWQRDIKKREYVAACVKGVLTLGLIAYLFYHSLFWIVILSPIFVLLQKMEEGKRDSQAAEVSGGI